MASISELQGTNRLCSSKDDLIEDSYKRIASQAKKIADSQKSSDQTRKEVRKEEFEKMIAHDTKYLVRLILGVTWSSKDCIPGCRERGPAPLSDEQKGVVRRLRGKIRQCLEDPENQEGADYLGMRADVIAIGRFCEVDLVDTTNRDEEQRSSTRKKAPAKKAGKPKSIAHRAFPLYDTETNPALAFLRKHFYGIQMARKTNARVADSKSSGFTKQDRQLKRQDLKKRLDDRREKEVMTGKEPESLTMQEVKALGGAELVKKSQDVEAQGAEDKS